MKFFTIILSLALFNFAKCQINTCYQLDENPFSYFSSKTAYNYVSAKENYTQPSTLHIVNYFTVSHRDWHLTREITFLQTYFIETFFMYNIKTILNINTTYLWNKIITRYYFLSQRFISFLVLFKGNHYLWLDILRDNIFFLKVFTLEFPFSINSSRYIII